MKLGKIFLTFLVCALTFLGECPCGSVASPLCPVRAVPVYPREMSGYIRCDCMHQFFGKNCRFKDQNGTVVLNATRVSQDTVILTWKEKQEQARRYLVSVRKMAYTLLGVTHNKWRTVRMESWSSNVTAAQSELFEGTKAIGHSAILSLPGASSYEVKVTSIDLTGENVGSISVFFDALNTSSSGQMLGISDALNNFKNGLMKDFQDECILKGIVAGVVVGTLGTLLMMAFVGVLIRYCYKCKKQRGKSVDDRSVAQKQVMKEVVTEDASDKDSNTEMLSRSFSYVMIDINDIVPILTETTATEATQKDENNNTLLEFEVNNTAYNPEEPIASNDNEPQAEKVRSVILDIPETVIDGESSIQEATVADTNTKDFKSRTIWDTIVLE